MGELVIILIVALLVLGPEKIPEAAKAIGKGMRELRKQTRVVQETLEQDEQLSSTVRELKSALRGEEPRPSIKPPAHGPVGRAPLGAPAPALPNAETTAATTAAIVADGAASPPASAPASAAAPAPALAPASAVATGGGSGNGTGSGTA